MEVFSSWMDKAKGVKKLLIFLLMFSLILFAIISVKSSSFVDEYIPKHRLPAPVLPAPVLPAPVLPAPVCPRLISQQTITPLNNTRHLLISAYMDRRVKGFDVRIISIFNKDSIKPLHCLFCCNGSLSTTTPASVSPHPEYFGFAYVTTAVMCQIPHNCNATHVTILTEELKQNPAKASNQTWLPLRNRNNHLTDKEKFNFTVCISTLFGNYDNVLQFLQTLEIYRLLGVNRVVIYKTNCSQTFDRLLQIYSQEGFLEVVPWPIHQYLNPSPGWLFSKSGGDVHYYGQMTTLNECIYRNMERSRYVLLNDLDEIMMPYQHKDLMSLMNSLQKQHPDVGVFLIENHVFPKTIFEPSGTFHLPQWNGVPGVNILEHVHKEEPDRKIYHPHKMIIQPRMVEQTSVHDVLKTSGPRVKVPFDICRLIHVRNSIRGPDYKDFRVDKRLWDFQELLVPRVDEVLKKMGLLNQTGRTDEKHEP